MIGTFLHTCANSLNFYIAQHGEEVDTGIKLIWTWEIWGLVGWGRVLTKRVVEGSAGILNFSMLSCCVFCSQAGQPLQESSLEERNLQSFQTRLPTSDSKLYDPKLNNGSCLHDWDEIGSCPWTHWVSIRYSVTALYSAEATWRWSSPAYKRDGHGSWRKRTSWGYKVSHLIHTFWLCFP